ncbi:MAG: hypothetical protein V4819_08990 [Verrucomicrobiota bacterium]
MSRRSRRHRDAGERRWLGKAAVGLLVLGIVCLGVGYAMLRSYLHSDAFRKFLSVEASDMGHVTGEFGPFHWDGLAVDTDSFEAKGEGLITGLRADSLHTEIGLGGVRRGVWEIRGSSLRRLEVSVDARKQGDENKIPEVSRKVGKKPKRPAWLPSEAELDGIDVRELVVKAILDEGLAVASGLSVHAEQAGAKDAYRMEIEGGTVRLPFGIVPELRVDRARLRYQDGQVFLTNATLAAWANGRIQGSGELEVKSRKFAIEGNASSMKCEDVLNADWAKRLTGDVASDFTVDNRPGFPQASGKLTIQNGVLTALPMLDALAAYADTRRFRVLQLSEAHTNWRWKEGGISLSNLVLASEGLVRLEGSIDIRGRMIDGMFRLGLAPGTLASIPGAETDVFIAGERGLLWTTLRISGSLDDPKEDLTDRLIAAAGLRMFDQIPETGEKVIKFTHSLLGEPSSKTIEKGVKLIEKSSKTVREVSGILDGLLGGETPAEPEKEPQ